MPTHDHRDEATYLRAALLLGLVSCEQVVTWAMLTVEEEAAPSAEMIDLSLTPPELTALREALRPLAALVENPETCVRLLDAAAEDYLEGRRALADTLTVLQQLARNVPIPDAWAHAIKELIDDHMLTQAGVPGQRGEIAPRLERWLHDTLAIRPDRSHS